MTGKKPYVAPTVTAHGGAVVRTQGRRGVLIELIEWRPKER
ncbi:MAG TPA: hypothetical protein VF746_17830 [Longimicrobium sp.]|jgi:hypothetical protein